MLKVSRQAALKERTRPNISHPLGSSLDENGVFQIRSQLTLEIHLLRY